MEVRFERPTIMYGHVGVTIGDVGQDELVVAQISRRGPVGSRLLIIPKSAAAAVADALIRADDRLETIELLNAQKPDPEEMNDKRAATAASCVRLFQELTGSDPETALGDMLCDLMHFADRARGFESFRQALDHACDHYDAETDSEGTI